MEKKVVLKTGNMHCVSCEKLIERAVMGVKGVQHVKSDYNTETTEIQYDDAEADLRVIRAAIEKEGHTVQEMPQSAPPAEAVVAQISDAPQERPQGETGTKIRFKGGDETRDTPGGSGGVGINFGTAALMLGAITILISLYFLLGNSISLDFSSINQNTGILILLLVGFLTGFHCIGMCGGFVLSYSGRIKNPHDIKPHLMYGAGKTISYTIIGAVFGLIGSIIAFTPAMRGTVAVLAGFFLVLYGINMLNLLPFLRKFQLRLPSLIPGVEWGGHGPLVTGLMNGLMLACGPLQALYIFAAGTGSPVAGATALFFFGLGTLVPLLTFGMVSRYFSAALTRDVLKFSGVLVVVMGLLMASNGLALLGIGLPIISTPGQQPGQQAQLGTASNIKLDANGYQVINMNVTSRGWEPNSFVLKKGVPVKWNINALELNGCNNEILVRDYGLDVKLKPGLQTVEFTPTNAGTVQFSCWMGMIRGQFLVYDASTGGSAASAPPAAPVVPSGGSCGGSGGGCGCGGARTN